MLGISGRSSRISSVGSQGSAISRGGVSGVSRSPSPSHRPGGGENIPMDVLDQAILARKQELQQDFRLELARNGRKVTNGADVAAIKRSIGGSIGMSLTKKNPTVLKSTAKPIVGVTPEGTQYFRINLKPDHLYDDNGLAPNERVLDDASDASKKPPASLSLGHHETPKKAAPHFTQLVQDENRLSPKPNRPRTGSRTPSPATVTVSRKSSFCSLFKSKETIVSPESPTTAGQRKKSAISVLLDSPRDRSRSKSRDSERSAPSQNGTPSKTKSVLAIFKPRRSGSKSKSSSPIDQEIMAAMEAQRHAPVDIRFVQEQAMNDPSRPKSAQRMRYYDTPTDGSIHIPLHTPPEERAMKDGTAIVAPVVRPSSAPRVGQIRAPPHPPPQPPTIHKPKVVGATEKKELPFHPKNMKPLMTNTTTTTSITQSVSRSQTPKIYRIENPDGSVRIPLRTPSDERVNIIGIDVAVDVAIDTCADVNNEGHGDIDVDNSNWSTAVQRNSSQESQETVVSSQAPSLNSAEHFGKAAEKTKTIAVIECESTAVTESHTAPVISATVSKPDVPTTVQSVTASPLTKEKKRILFSTRIGSGSEEQIFATQLSLSKTESLSSQLSEQAVLDSPSHDTSNGAKAIEGSNQVGARGAIAESPHAVRMRPKDENGTKRQDSANAPLTKEELINSNRHSMYIENIDEILQRERQSDIARKEFKRQQKSEQKLESMSSHEKDAPQTSSKLHPGLSAEDRAFSSESERDSEADLSMSKLHMPCAVGAVEEESTGLVAQESYDDELPYVPTTLPEERSCAIPIIPVKERALMEVKTYPLDRPRSTTPLNPAFLEDYCGSQPDESEFLSARGEKLRISLPRKESRDRGQKNKSPRRVSNTSGKSWFEFAEQGIGGVPAVGSPSSVSSITGSTIMVTSSGSGRRSSNSNRTDDEPPPVPPRKTPAVAATTAASASATEWINFENIPEKRKAPKRITTLPQKDSQEICGTHPMQYVNPAECQCECHERDDGTGVGAAGGSGLVKTDQPNPPAEEQSPDDCVPLLESDPDECVHRTE